MTVRRIDPGAVNGRVRAPPSKSYTHRALIVGHLASHGYVVRRPLYAADTLATRQGVRALGTQVSGGRTAWRLAPDPRAARGARLRRIQCGESGTTLRFLSAVAAREPFAVRFEGAPALSARPMGGLVTALRGAGVAVEAPAGGSLPMVVRGPLRAGRFRVDGSVSSQYVSAILLTLPTLAGRSTLEVTGGSVSRPYIDATLAVLRAHGVTVRGGAGRWTVPGDQRWRGRSFTVPGDASSAAYLWAAAAVTGGQVTVTEVPPRWPQADRRVLGALAQAGAVVRERGDSVTVRGPLSDGFDIDLTESPDLYPLLGAVAAVVPHRSTLRGAAHVVFKESNRRAATIDLVRRLGGRTVLSRRGLEVWGSRRVRRLRGFASSDHRLVMSAAVAALVAPGGASLSDASAVGKSYPGFWADLARLGARCQERP